MRGKIDHEQVQKGLVFKKTFHAVRCEVTFTEEELHLIKLHKLQDEVIYERLPSAELGIRRDEDVTPFYLYVKTLLRGPDTYCMETEYGAKTYEEGLIEKLKEVKEYLTEINQGVDQRSKTLEF